MSAITDALDRLADGSSSIEEVVAEFARMNWPKRTPSGDPMAQEDPVPDEPGSFAEVEQAFVDGRITSEQYGALVDARTKN